MATSPVAPAGRTCPLLVEHGDVGTGGLAHGSGFADLVGERIARHLVRGLGHSVGLDHRDVEGCLEVVQHADRQRRRRRAHEPEGRRQHLALGGARARHLQHRLVDRRDRGVPGRSELLDPSGNVSARKPSVQTTLPPATSEPKSAATSPWMWKSGITFRHRSVGSSRSVSATLAADVSRLRSVSGTSFGEPVVPEVNNSRAASVSPALLDAPSPGDKPEQTIDPAVSPASSSITGIPHDDAAPRPRFRGRGAP